MDQKVLQSRLQAACKAVEIEYDKNESNWDMMSL